MERDISFKDFHPVLSVRDRIYFLQLVTYGKYKEKRSRQQFEKRFNFLSFIKKLILSRRCGRFVPGAGIEPAQHRCHWCLRPARLPIPPSGLNGICNGQT
jgi:hypothetical protein